MALSFETLSKRGRAFSVLGRKLRTVRTLLINSSLMPESSFALPFSGFATKSSAPSSSALKTFSFWL